MAKAENWPQVHSGHITVGNPESNIAIATLWTRRDRVVGELDPDAYAIAGQLYSRDGVSLALRNLLSNPNVRHLVVGGEDLENTGAALVNLWQKGMDNNRNIRGVDKAIIHQEIPVSAIDRLRENVSLHDLRDLKHEQMVRKVRELVVNLPKLLAWGEQEFYPLPPVNMKERMPSEPGAHLVRGKKVGETWLKIQQAVMRYGEDGSTCYQNNARDLSNLVVVVTGEDPEHPEVPDYLEFTVDGVRKYMDEFLNPVCPPGINYTYGERLFAFGSHKINQAEIMVDKLQRDPNDRGVVAVLYDPYHDNQLDVEKPMSGFRNPCIVYLQAAIKESKLELAAFFRSNDMFAAWPENAFGLLGFQKWMADRLEKYPLGPLTTCSMRAHIYEEPWSRVNNVLEGYRTRALGFEEDPRGSFIIDVDQKTGKIALTHCAPDGHQLEEPVEFDGTASQAALRIGSDLLRADSISQVSHALYLGRESAMAELAAKLGLPYKQSEHHDLIKKIIELAKR